MAQLILALRNLILNTFHSIGVSSALRSKKQNQVTVLSLHRISAERNSFWNPIQPHTFEALLKYVKKHYTVVNFSELQEASIQKPKKPLLILSFDDGYYDFYEYALPLLVKHGLTANHNIVNVCANKNETIWTEKLNILFEFAKQNTSNFNVEFDSRATNLSDFGGNWMSFYLSIFKELLETPKFKRTQIIGDIASQVSFQDERKMMNWDEIRECASNKIEIGSHTFSHDSLGTISDLASLEREIIESKTLIEQEINQSVKVLALPNGQTGKLADELIAKSEYQYVLYVNEKLVQLPLSTLTVPIQINRINLVDEPFQQMALRIEMFHNYIRKYV